MAILERTGNTLFGALGGGLKGVVIAAAIGAVIIGGPAIWALAALHAPILGMIIGGTVAVGAGAVSGVAVGGGLFGGLGAIFGGAKGITKPTREQQTANLQAQLAQSRAQGIQNSGAVGADINYRQDWAAQKAAEQQRAVAQGNAR